MIRYHPHLFHDNVSIYKVGKAWKELFQLRELLPSGNFSSSCSCSPLYNPCKNFPFTIIIIIITIINTILIKIIIIITSIIIFLYKRELISDVIWPPHARNDQCHAKHIIVAIAIIIIVIIIMAVFIPSPQLCEQLIYMTNSLMNAEHLASAISHIYHVYHVFTSCLKDDN